MQDNGGPTGPYDFATGQNDDSTWIDNGFATKVDANIKGMGDYAKTVTSMGLDLASVYQTLQSQFVSITEDGAFSGGTGELQYAFQAIQTNSTEFGLFMKNMTDGILSTASAAQVIADAYSGSDAFGAASLDAVQFAFDLPGGKRPEGLPKVIGQTYWQKAQADAAAAQNQPAGQANDSYRRIDTEQIPGGTITTYIDTTTGQVRTVQNVTQDGHNVVTITNGKNVIVTDTSTWIDPTGTVTTVKTTANGKTTTQQTNEYTSNVTSDSYSEYTDTYSDGQLSGRTVVTNYTNGSKTTTDYSYTNGNQSGSSSYTVGPDSSADPTAPDTPDQDQLQQLNQQKIAAVQQGY